jgi:hypothetical protein
MPTPTYTPLATVTLGTAAASVTFSSIPATYRDLILVASLSSSTNDNNLAISLNSSTANFSRVIAYGSSAGIASGSFSDNVVGYVTTTLGSQKIDFMDYSATDKHKTILSRSDHQSFITMMTAARWASTSAITTIGLSISSNNITTGSTFSLYGVIA